MNFILIQFIGAIGYLTLSVSYFKEEKLDILFIQIIASILFTIHFYLLDGINGAICNFIGLFALESIYLFVKYKWKNMKIAITTFVLLLIIINIATFQNIFSIFPTVAAVISILAFLNEDENIIRGIGIISAICWIIYAIVYKSYVSIMFETITFIFTSIAFLKYKLNPRCVIQVKKQS